MAGEFDRFRDGMLQEISGELYDLNKEMEQIKESVGASSDALEKQHKIINDFMEESIERIDEYANARKKAIDEDIKESYENRAHEAQKSFDSNINHIVSEASSKLVKDFDISLNRVIGSSESHVRSLNSELEDAAKRFKAIERYKTEQSIPKWAKILIVFGFALMMAMIPLTYVIGKKVATQQEDNTLMTIISMSPDELAETKEKIENLNQ